MTAVPPPPAAAHAHPSAAATPPLPRATKVWYGLGQAAEGIKNEGFTLFLLFYYTSVLGLPGALAGQVIFIALLFDAVTDPLAGVLSDRLRSGWGRRHPFLYASALPVSVCFYLTFAPPAGLSHAELFAWLVTFVILTRFAMTLFHVPHMALGAELSSDYEERTTIVTLQYAFARAGHGFTGAVGLLVFMRPTPEFPTGQLDPAAYPPMALTCAVLIGACILLSAWRTHSRIPHLARPDPRVRDRGVLGTLVWDNLEALRNASFRALFLGNTLTFVGWGVASILGLHLATYFWRVSTDELLVWGIAAGVGIFGGLPWWRGVASRIDKKPTYILGLAIFTLFAAAPPLAKLAGLWPAEGSPLYVPLFVLTTGLLAHFGIASCMVTGRSMMADVTDEDALAHGRRREGIFFGAISFTAKASFGLGGQIAGLVVDGVGLVPHAAPDAVGPEVARGLGLAYGGAILGLCGLSLVFFARYRLTRDVHARVRTALADRDAAAAGEAP